MYHMCCLSVYRPALMTGFVFIHRGLILADFKFFEFVFDP